jgi:large subunit ribosomal protein L13
MKRNSTFSEKEENVKRKWYLIDAKGKTLGRIATVTATILRGKGKATFTPHVDCGDYVVIINAKAVAVTGKKEEQKMYFTHSGYHGGHRLISLGKVRSTHPERIIRHAVEGMLPKNFLSSRIINKLKIYAGTEHPYAKLKPEEIKF